MGKSSPSPPPAPDPVATGNAQTATNVETARTNAALNRVSQFGPDGSVVYSQPDTVGNPNTYYQTTTLSPREQNIYDSTRIGQQIYAAAGANQIYKASNLLSTPYADPNAGAQTGAVGAAQGAVGAQQAALQRAQAAAGQPVNTDYNSVRQGAINAANSRLLPEQQMQEETLRSRLLNSGITEGSAAWNNAYRQQNNSNNDAQQQSILNAENLAGQSISQTAALRQIPISEQGQVSSLAGNVSNSAGNVSNLAGAGIQQSTAVRDQPLNETAALLNGSQVSSPQFGSVPGTTVAPTDLVGATLGAGGLANQNYAQRVQQQSAANGGLYSLAGTAAVAGALAFSDERMKKDIRRVGETDEGTPIYTYKFKGGGPAQMGVMAQELAKKTPEAVAKTRTGFFAVDYGQVR